VNAERRLFEKKAFVTHNAKFEIHLSLPSKKRKA